MMEKQVILSKIEFDEMEQELSALKETVESKTITVITKYDWYSTEKYNYSAYRVPIGTRLEFIMGVDENEIIKELSDEIESLRKENDEYKSRVHTMGKEMWDLRDEKNSWKKLPWYRRLFIK
jgi:hypothetical protein